MSKYFSLPSDPDSEQTFRGLVLAFKDHWREFRPRLYRALKKEGEERLDQAAKSKAEQMLTMFHNLSGPMGAHQAWYEAWKETANTL